MCGISANDWNTMLMSLRRSARSWASECRLMSCPSITMRPAVGSIKRFSRRTRVDLPEPDRPMMTKISPAWMCRFASNTAMEWPVWARMSCLDTPCRTRSRAVSGASPKTLKTWSMVISFATRRAPFLKELNKRRPEATAAGGNPQEGAAAQSRTDVKTPQRPKDC